MTVVTVRFNRRIPGALIGLVGSTALVAALDLQAHGVAVLGPIKSGVPSVGLHGLSWSDVQSLAPLAAVVALVVVTQTAATTRAFAEQGGYDVDAGRDFLAVGAGSVVAGLVGSFPVDASPPRTGAVVTAGGRTQAGLLGAAAVVVVLIPIAGVLKDVPLATLAAILIFVALRLFHVHDLMAIARFSRLRIRPRRDHAARRGVRRGRAGHRRRRPPRHARPDPPERAPQLHVLGRVPGSTSWTPLAANPDATLLPGVLAVLFATPIWYANAVHFREQVAAAVAEHGPTQVLVLDTLGMSDIDFTGSRELARALDAGDRDHIRFGIARAGDHLRASLRRSGLEARIGADHFYTTVDEAVTSLTAGPTSPRLTRPNASSARTGRWSDPASGNTRPRTGRRSPRTKMWSIWLCGRQAGQVRPLTARRQLGMNTRTSGPQVFMSPTSTASGRAAVFNARRSSAQLRGEP